MDMIPNNLLTKIGITGGILAIDNIPPFLARFDWYPENFSWEDGSEYDYVRYPGAAYSFPIFKNKKPRVYSFTVVYDLANRNNQYYIDTQEDVNEGVDIGNGRKFYFKGANTISSTTQQETGVDYISMMKSLYEKLTSPKFGASAAIQNATGKILQVSQGKSDPCPPLSLLVKNTNEMFLGYLSEANPTELNLNRLGICTRIQFSCKFLVTPDLIFNTRDEVIRELNVTKSLTAIL